MDVQIAVSAKIALAFGASGHQRLFEVDRWHGLTCICPWEIRRLLEPLRPCRARYLPSAYQQCGSGGIPSTCPPPHTFRTTVSSCPARSRSSAPFSIPSPYSDMPHTAYSCLLHITCPGRNVVRIQYSPMGIAHRSQSKTARACSHHRPLLAVGYRSWPQGRGTRNCASALEVHIRKS